MRLFIDTANIEEIREIARWGVLTGVTTNPSLVAKEGRDFREVLDEILALVDGPISAEVLSLEAGAMVREARELVAVHSNVVIKIPMTPEGLQATKVLAAEGVKVNTTLVFSANQALLAATVGTAYVSPFVGRLDDAGHDGMAVVREIVEVFELHGFSTEVITASVRHPQHVTEAALAGSHIATVPHAVFKAMVKHPLTDVGVERFLADWKKLEAETQGPAVTQMTQR